MSAQIEEGWRPMSELRELCDRMSPATFGRRVAEAAASGILLRTSRLGGAGGGTLGLYRSGLEPHALAALLQQSVDHQVGPQEQLPVMVVRKRCLRPCGLLDSRVRGANVTEHHYCLREDDHAAEACDYIGPCGRNRPGAGPTIEVRVHFVHLVVGEGPA